MTTKLADIATIFDTLADYVDATEGASLRKKQAAVEEKVATFASRYEETTGAQLPADLRGKLASLDEDALEHVLKIAHVPSSSPETLGGPDDDTETKTAAANDDDPNARFVRWAMSSD